MHRKTEWQAQRVPTHALPEHMQCPHHYWLHQGGTLGATHEATLAAVFVGTKTSPPTGSPTCQWGGAEHTSICLARLQWVALTDAEVFSCLSQ